MESSLRTICLQKPNHDNKAMQFRTTDKDMMILANRISKHSFNFMVEPEDLASSDKGSFGENCMSKAYTHLVVATCLGRHMSRKA